MACVILATGFPVSDLVPQSLLLTAFCGFLQVSGHLDYMRQMDTILKAVGIQTKQCPLEAWGNLAAISTQPKEYQESVSKADVLEEQSILGDDENSVGLVNNDHWMWEPVPNSKSLPKVQTPSSVSKQRTISEMDQNVTGLGEPCTSSSLHSTDLSRISGPEARSADALSPMLR